MASRELVPEKGSPTQADIEEILKSISPLELVDSDHVISILDHFAPVLRLLNLSQAPQIRGVNNTDDFLGVGLPVRCETGKVDKHLVLGIDAINALWEAGKNRAAIQLDMAYWNQAANLFRPNRRRPSTDFIDDNYRILANTTFLTFEQ